MKAAEEIYVEWIDNEAVLLNRQTGQLHYLNPQAALVFALIEEHGYDEAMRELHERFAREPTLDADLETLIDSLLERGVLVDG